LQQNKLVVRLPCIEAEDYYNFNPGQADIATGALDADNGRFEVLGWAKGFYSRGTLKREVTWKQGAVPPESKTVSTDYSPWGTVLNGRSRDRNRNGGAK
jgi:hypothetical protein